MKSNGKKSHLDAHEQLANKAPQATPASPVEPPTQNAPEVPVGFTPPRLLSGRFHFLTHAQIESGTQLGKDLAAAQQPDFGPNAPSVAKLGTMLGVASAWSEERERAERWVAYAKAQEAVAWTPLLDELVALKPAYDYAVLRDGSFAKRYASLGAYYAVRKASAQRAVRTRKERAQQKASPAPVTPQPPPAPAPTAPSTPPDPTKAGPTS